MPLTTLARELYAEHPAKVLYHYTSLNGLMAITRSQFLFATDVRFFNDAAELKHTADLLRIHIAQRLERSNANNRLLNQLRDWLSHRLTDGHMLYVVSFTANGNLLSQWRGYCPPSKGVSIGFSPRRILECADAQSFQIGKCIYTHQIQWTLTEQIITAFETLAAECGENTDASQRHPSNSFHDVFEKVEADLLRIAVLIKHPSFAEEEEWRAISPVVTNYVEPPIFYREGASMLVPYLQFKLPRTSNGALDIDSIFLGPTPIFHQSMTSLSRFLLKNDANPKNGVTYCQIPFRP